MARMRIIKPEFWTSDQVMELSRDARLAFIGLWNFCDDAGIHSANAKRLKAEVFPCDDDLSSAGVRALVDEMIKHGLVLEYEAIGEMYWQVTGWHHQKIDQPTYKHPSPDGTVPAGVARRRAANAAAAKQGERAPKPTVEQGEQAASPSHGDGECSDGVREVFAEQSPSDPGVFDGCSPPEWKGMEGSGVEGNVKEKGSAARVASLPPETEKSEPVQADLLGDAPAAGKKATPPTGKKAKPEMFNAVAYLTAAGVGAQVVDDWIAHRKKKTASVTKTVIEELVEQAALAGISLEKAMRECCLRGWQGFKAEWYLRDQQGAASQQRGGFMTRDERNRAISEANMRAFLEGDGATPFDALPPPHDPFTIDME